MVTPDNAHIGNIEKIMLRDVWNLKHRCSTRDEETLFVSSLRWLPQNDQTAALVEVPPLFSDWTDPSMGICPVMSVNRICICIHVIERVPSMGICSPWQLVRRRDGHVANMPRGHCNNVQCAGGLKQGQDFKIKVKITFYTTAWLWVFLCITRLCRLWCNSYISLHFTYQSCYVFLEVELGGFGCISRICGFCCNS